MPRHRHRNGRLVKGWRALLGSSGWAGGFRGPLGRGATGDRLGSTSDQKHSSPLPRKSGCPDEQGESEPARAFVVECYWPGMVEEDARSTLDRVDQLGGEALLGSMRSLGCILVASDGMALFLFEAQSEDVVRRIGRLAEVPFDRIVETALVGFDPQPI